MGEPSQVVPGYSRPNKIGRQGATGELKHLSTPEEEKSTEIARVAASESAPSPNPRTRYSPGRCDAGSWDPPPGLRSPGAVTKGLLSGTAWKGGETG